MKNNYHGQQANLTDEYTLERIGENHPSSGQVYAADRESSPALPFLERPVTIMYPYERLEDMEPWLFVPGNYNGRIELFGRPALHVRHVLRPVLMTAFI